MSFRTDDLLVTFYEREFLNSPLAELDLNLAVDFISDVFEGGPKRAKIIATGDERCLWQLPQMLRTGVCIYDDAGRETWWGMVHEVRVQIGVVTWGLSLEQMTNRVAVTYSDGFEQQITTVAEDTLSVEWYGIKEAIYGSDAESDIEAAATRDTFLGIFGRPAPTIEMSGNQDRAVRAEIYCVGWWDVLAWQFYEEPCGLVDAAQILQGKLRLGIGFTSTDIQFVDSDDNYIIGPEMTVFEVDDQFAISGSVQPDNNSIYCVTGVLDGSDQRTYTSNTISFSAADDIQDSANGLLLFQAGDLIQVNGSASNDGTYVVARVLTDGDRIEVAGGGISNEGPGATVTISSGVGVVVDNLQDVDPDGPGTAITVQGLMQHAGQAFTVDCGSDWDASRVQVRVAVVGAPVDNLRVQLRADAGQPGAVLTSVDLLGAGFSTSALWYDFDFAPVTLTNGARYWVTVTRSGAASLTDYYLLYSSGLAQDSTVFDSRVYASLNGTSWTPAKQDVLLAMRVVRAIETSAQAATIAGAGQFVASTHVITPSGVASSDYRAPYTTIRDHLEALVARGTSNNRRLAMRFTHDRRLLIGEESAQDDYFLDRDGTFYEPGGHVLPPHLLKAGSWVRVQDVAAASPSLGLIANQGRVFLEEVEYNVLSRRLRVRPRGISSFFEFLVRGG